MEKSYLFSSPWKNALVVFLAIGLSFLDSYMPPLGIPITVLFIFILFWVRRKQVKGLGLYKPKSWGRTIALGFIVGLLIPIVGIYLISPLRDLMGVAQENPEMFATIEGNNSMLILVLVVSWTTAGFGEELIFRAFFIGQISSVFKDRRSKYMISLLISSLVFGAVHYQNGVDAIIATTINGFILGLVYLKTDRNIWSGYFAHGVANTVAFLLIYSGMYRSL